MPDSHFEKTILNHLHQGDLNSAKQILAAWELSEPLERLRLLFCQGKVFLYEGSYLKALETLQACHMLAPQDLDVLCDIALCLYQLGLQSELDLTLQKCRNLFQILTPTLASQKDLDHAIFLAKLYEDKALYAQALELLSTPRSTQLSPWQEQSLRIQLLRVSVEMQDLKHSKELYSEVLSGTEHNLSFEIEREHALMLADCALFGISQAQERFEYALTHNLSPADQSFLKSEFAELAILNKRMDLLQKLQLLQDSESAYEKEQAKLVSSHLSDERSLAFSIIRLEKILSPMSLLRLLRQALLLFPESPQLEAWTERYKFHSMNLPTRPLQDQFLTYLYATKEVPQHLQVNARRKVILLNGRELSVKSKLFWQLLKAFPENQLETSIEKVISLVYEEVPNAQHFDRLRIGIYRLNDTLEKSCDLKGLFRITKHTVTLSIPTQEQAS